MASNNFTLSSFMLRFVFAIFLVYASYNPSGHSVFHWAKESFFGEAGLTLTPPFAMSCILILIGWTVYIRATLRSLGTFGLLLVGAFFAIIVWWLVDIGLIGVDSINIMTYLLLFLFAAVLATGISWSHIRRRLSGQMDVDEMEG